MFNIIAYHILYSIKNYNNIINVHVHIDILDTIQFAKIQIDTVN